MNRSIIVGLLVAAGTFAPGQALACGEGAYSMGEGLRFQNFLAPRPAVLLVYDTSVGEDPERLSVYRGLARAGHQLTFARNRDELNAALAKQQHDVVITGFNGLDVVTEPVAKFSPDAKLLPIVSRSEGSASELGGRFQRFLWDGASLGQYLKLIDQLIQE